jgi:hypothetical protein
MVTYFMLMTALWLAAVWFFFSAQECLRFLKCSRDVVPFVEKKGPGALYPALTATTRVAWELTCAATILYSMREAEWGH